MKSVDTLQPVRKLLLRIYLCILSAATFTALRLFFFLILCHFCAIVTICAIIYMAANFKAIDKTSQAATASCMPYSDVECLLIKFLSRKLKRKIAIESNIDLKRFLASSRTEINFVQLSDTDNRPTDSIDVSQMLTNNLKFCVYTEFSDFDSRIDVTQVLSMIHVNIRSLQKLFDTLAEMLQLLFALPQLICITETKINKEPLVNIELENYHFLHASSVTQAGGVGIYISKDISFNLIGENTHVGGGCEDLWISISTPGIKRKIVIALLYCHPSSDPLAFFETLDKKIKSIKNCDMYLLGDLNLNILNEYLSMLAGNGLFPLITKPTRITQESATLIDHIFTSAIANPIFPGIILSDISDHFFTYCAIPSKQPTGPEKQSKFLSRNIKNLDVEKYLLDLDKEMNDFKLNCPSISKENYEVVFAKFVKLFKFVIDKHAPLMKVFRMQRRLQSKPWLKKYCGFNQT